jgi:apolipoprotein N-acyltransferase
MGRSDLWLAAASGLLLGAAFLPVPLGWLAWTAFVPLLIALERRVAAGANKRQLFALGYAGGLAFFLTGIHWIALLSDVASTIKWIKYVAWICAGAYLAVYWGLAALLAGALARRSGVAARWAFVIALMLIEELRGAGELGFPWFQPGYTQAQLPALQLAAYGSVTLVTLWVLALNASLLGALRRRSLTEPALAVALLVLPSLVGVLAPKPAAPSGVSHHSVALVQGNVPGEIKWAGDHQQQILDGFLALSDTAVARGPGAPMLVLWPETATGSYLRKSLDQSIAVAAWAHRNATPIFTGFADYSFGKDGKPQPWNAAGQWGADGSLSEIYAKRHLVPFGERIPFQWLIPALGKIDFGQAEWLPGTAPVLFPTAAGPFSTLICFESIFPELARGDVQQGARWLVVITNDEWFGNSAALYQHADMARFRAVENGVPLARVANTGLTELIDARGNVVARLPVFTPAVLRAELPPALPQTLYSRLGDWPGWLAAIAALAMALGLLRVPEKRSAAR